MMFVVDMLSVVSKQTVQKCMMRCVMSKKVFVSYKYEDNDVQYLQTTRTNPTWPCDYVENISEHVLHDEIYKGESQSDDLSGYSDGYIWEI